MAISQKHLATWLQRHKVSQPTKGYESAQVDGSISSYHNTFTPYKSQHYKSYNNFTNAGCFHPSRPVYRWIILLLAANMMLSSYFSDETIPATVPYLKSEYKLNSQQIALLYSASFVPNLVMTILGGILVDKYGVNKMSLIFSTFLLFGTAIFAFSPNYYGKMVGRVVFGLGFESLEVTQDAIITRWFFTDTSSPSLAFSYGFTFAASQLGQLLGQNILPVIANFSLFYCYSLATIVVFVVGTLSNIILIIMDSKASPILHLDGDDIDSEEGDFSFKTLKLLPFKFWIICFITVFSYTVILVFMAFSTDLLVTKFGVTADNAGHISSVVYGLSILLSPLLGYFVDKYGNLLIMLIFGIISLITGILILGLTMYVPYIGLTFIGIAYGIIPNCLWPSISLIVGNQVAGTAFGGVTGVNSLGLLLFPYLLGYLHDHFNNSYTPSSIAAASLATIGLLLAIFLYIADFVDGSWINNGIPNPNLPNSNNNNNNYNSIDNKSNSSLLNTPNEKMPLLNERNKLTIRSININ